MTLTYPKRALSLALFVLNFAGFAHAQLGRRDAVSLEAEAGGFADASGDRFTPHHL
jgi:hypothetical protein